VEAHIGIFDNGDIENGKPRQLASDDDAEADGGPVRDLVLIDGLKQSMEETVVMCCELLRSKAEKEVS
jgi:hypothetical protein